MTRPTDPDADPIEFEIPVDEARLFEQVAELGRIARTATYQPIATDYPREERP